MKILSFMNPVRFGGGERLMLDLGDFFRREGVDFWVVNLNRSAEFEEKLAAHGLHFMNIGNAVLRQTPSKKEYIGLLFSLLRRLPAIRRTVKATAPDRVLANGFPAIVLVALALAFVKRRPALIYVHHFMKAKERPLVAAVYRMFLRQYDKVVAVSSRTRETLVAQFPELAHKIVFVPNGIDTERFALGASKVALRRELGLPEHGVIAICVGRLTAFKNQRLLVDLAAMVQRKDFYMLIAGDGDEYEHISRLIAQHHFEDRVRLLGPVDSEELPRYLAAADLFPYPSLKEGFGIVVAEAMAAGLPTLILQNIAIQEFGDGAIVAKDEAEFLATAAHLVEDGHLRERHGAAARAYVRDHLDMRVTGKQFLEAIQ